MKIAVPFANGEVFQHFGHTENFKLYEIKAGQIVSSQIIDTLEFSFCACLLDFYCDMINI